MRVGDNNSVHRASPVPSLLTTQIATFHVNFGPADPVFPGLVADHGLFFCFYFYSDNILSFL